MDPRQTRGFRNRNPGNIDHQPANRWQGLDDPPIESAPPGGRARFAVSSPTSDAKSGGILRAGMVETFASLADVRIDYCWGGLVDVTQDRLPHAGERDGLFYSTGYSGHGTQMSVLMGERMAAEVGRLVPGAKLRVVPNWADGAAIRPMASGASALRREWGLEGKFAVGYSGNLGRVHDCDTLLAAARLLAAEVPQLPGDAEPARQAGLPTFLRPPLSQLHAPSGRGSS